MMKTPNSKKQKKVKAKKKKVKVKKKVVVVKKEPEKIERYRIIITSQNKLMVCVFKANNRKKALTAFNKIITENKKSVRFPIRYSSRDHKLMESKYELLLMKNKSDGESDETLLRNEYGRLVPHKSSNSKMIIYAKSEYLFEETFWVYGMNPRFQRKDFNYILNEIVLNNLPKVKYPVKRIIIYKNKLIIQDDNDFEMVICKCENDAARLYTEIEKELTKLKYKSVFFAGIAKESYKNSIIEMIQKKTGWDLLKIRRNSTRP